MSTAPRTRSVARPNCCAHAHGIPQHIVVGAQCSPTHQLLASVASSYGDRAVGVILTGMGKDGSLGARALREAGGTVIAQIGISAEHPEMPNAAVQLDAVDLILPLPETGSVLHDLVTGGELPRSDEDQASAERLFAGSDEVSTLYRSMDWRNTPLGPVTAWPDELRTLVAATLESPTGICILWGPDLLQLYDDPYRMVMGNKHPAGLGQPNRECWPEVWHINEPIYAESPAVPWLAVLSC